MSHITLPPIGNNISIIINEEDYNNQSSIDLESFLKAFNFLEDADYSIQNSIEINEDKDEQIFDSFSQYDEPILSSIDENFLPSESNSIINDNNDVYNSSLKLTEFHKNFNDNIDISLNQINPGPRLRGCFCAARLRAFRRAAARSRRRSVRR